MILIDSSAWIEYFTSDSPHPKVSQGLKELSAVITPTVVLYEVYKKLKKTLSEQHADEAAAQMMKTRIVPLSDSVALAAAEVSLEHSLAMADSIVYATALEFGCKIVTLDNDFRKLPLAQVLSR